MSVPNIAPNSGTTKQEEKTPQNPRSSYSLLWINEKKKRKCVCTKPQSRPQDLIVTTPHLLSEHLHVCACVCVSGVKPYLDSSLAYHFSGLPCQQFPSHRASPVAEKLVAESLVGPLSHTRWQVRPQYAISMSNFYSKGHQWLGFW